MDKPLADVSAEMAVDKDAPIPVRDGAILRASVFRPAKSGRYPVIMSMGIYGKDVHFADAYKPQWEALKRLQPAIDADGSSGRYLRWELPDPERWVPHGYVVIAIDSRGSGKSAGYLDPFSPQETRDYYDAIEWAAVQEWSSGKVGLLGISYYSITQWQVAGLQPPHLAAICPWEGGSDLYRDWSHHGGIFSSLFPTAWYPRQVLPNQNGNEKSHFRDRETGERTTGLAVNDALLPGNRAEHARDLLNHPLDDAWYQERSPRLARIRVPLLSAGNWGGAGLHLRGNIEGFMRAGSSDKWLGMHVGTHFESFYLPEFVAQQRRFFDHYLKGLDNGWTSEPKVQLAIRRPEGATVRAESEWPIGRTQWTKFFLDSQDRTLDLQAPSASTAATYRSLGEGIDFSTPPFAAEMEFTGPLVARLWISSTTTDMDIFASLRMFDPDGKEVVFTGASDLAPVARGWLRASHRKLDPDMSLPWRPYHTHDDIQKLTPNQPYPVDVEIWPTSIVFPKGYRMVLTLQGRDFEASNIPGRILHNHEADRPASEFDALNTIHTGAGHESYLLMPRIPQ
jgi:predicted acyl esterase